LREAAIPDPIKSDVRLWEWEFVRAIARKKANWYSRIVFIPADWLVADRDASRRLDLWVHRTAWRQSRLLHLHVAHDTIELADETLLVTYHTARHLRLIAGGDAPAFHLIRNDEPAHMLAGPFHEVRTVLEKALSKAKIKHTPLILQPFHLTASGDSGYFSLSRPTLLGPRLPPQRRNQAEALDDIWKNMQEIHGQRRSCLDLEQTTGHTPWEGSNPPSRRRRKGIGLHAYLCKDLGLPDGPDDPVPEFCLRNSRGQASFFTSCIRVVRR
jgi:hypothetical protein